jgi:DNA polymerase-3 subunit alpha
VSLAEFVHLHNHSQYSLLDGACRIDDMLKTAEKMKMPALAITDHGNLFGAIEFYTKARKHKVKPIIGIETYVAPESRHKKSVLKGFTESGYHLLLLARNETGYRNLIKLSSIGFLEGFYHKPRVDKEVLREFGDGLIACSACLNGEIARNILNGRFDEADRAVREYLDIFGKDNFYLELQNHKIDEEDRVRAALKKIARQHEVRLVATNDCHYMKREHSRAHDALLCIQTGKIISETDRMRYNTDQIYFKSADEMIALFSDTPEAIENTLRIAESCSLEISLYKNKVPKFPLPESFQSLEDYLRHSCEEGLGKRYREITPELEQRLNFELSVINRMGYAGYFLIVKDFIDYARRQGIRVGPGRGSAAGSIVSYCLGITSLDPIKYGLLFERFLNPERITMPDIDIDFADRGRDQVIDYVTQKYGRDNVAQIITFGSMAARAAVRDVGRVMSLPYGEVDAIAKLIPFEMDMTLDKAIEREAELKKRYEEDERIRELIEFSKVLEGLSRHASTHAAGVVIAPGPIMDYAPLYKSNKDEITTQYDMHGIEAIGLLKMDFLGLRTLTVLDDCLQLLAKNGTQVDIDNIPLGDPEVYRLFTRAETIGVFQFESSGMRDYLRKLKPTVLEDLTVMNALYRPGPLDAHMIDIYIDCKHGKRKIEYIHPKLESILKVTYGVIVFQEQVLKIAQELAGYTLGEADVLRKAMGKKQAEIMAEQKGIFIKGAQGKGVDRAMAERIFEQIETFGRYGFVKAHSACYAFIAYQTAYLKVHHPVEFMAALMTSEMSDTNRIMELRNECERMDIEVKPPDINRGYGYFSVDGNIILFGLTAVKNVGQGAVDSIVTARNDGGPFQNLFDFTSRVDLRLVNKRTIESLVMSGAMDSLGPHRAALLAGVESAIAHGSSLRKEIESGQSTLFGNASHDILANPRIPDTPAWSYMEILTREKESLGYWISGHPLDAVKDLYDCYVDLKLGDLENARDNQEVVVSGVLTRMKIQSSRAGKPFAILNLEDFTGAGEVLIFADLLEKRRPVLRQGNIIVIFGSKSASVREGEKPIIKGSDLTLLEMAPKEFPIALRIKIENSLDDVSRQSLLNEFESNPGDCELIIEQNGSPAAGKKVTYKSSKYRVNPSPKFLKRLRMILGPECLRLQRVRNNKRHSP